jgi:hypothetical protein
LEFLEVLWFRLDCYRSRCFLGVVEFLLVLEVLYSTSAAFSFLALGGGCCAGSEWWFWRWFGGAFCSQWGFGFFEVCIAHSFKWWCWRMVMEEFRSSGGSFGGFFFCILIKDLCNNLIKKVILT